MGKTVIGEETFPKIVEEYLQSRGITPDVIQFFIWKGDIYQSVNYHSACFVGRDLEADTDHFSESVANTADGVFMDLDELCGRTALSAAHQAEPVTDPRPAAMERLVHELISDRLLTLSRYITLDSSTRTILIDQTSLSADGYQVVTH